MIARIVNDFGEMKKGEIRRFKIDITLKQDCKLHSSNNDQNILEVKIKKVKTSSSSDYFGKAWTYHMIGKPTDVYLRCGSGYYNLKIAELELGCGIAQILIRLCLNEETIHDVKNSKNKANRMIKNSHYSNGDELSQWISSNCEKIVYVRHANKMDSKIPSLYLQGAILSKYDRAIILFKKQVSNHPSFTFTTEILGRYDGNGKIVMDEQRINRKAVSIENSEWFFCFRKVKR